jgi:hypothetical protein
MKAETGVQARGLALEPSYNQVTKHSQAKSFVFICSFVWRNIGSAGQLAGAFPGEVLTLPAAVGKLGCEAFL